MKGPSTVVALERAAGFTERELDLMYKDNPATARGLPPLLRGTK